jgi:protein gp37
MADQRGKGISWTDRTWGPVRGCSRVSEGCRHCYAEQVAARFAGPGQPYEGLAKKVGGEARWTGEVRFIEEHLADPLKWRKPRRIFVNSMSDLFHEKLTDEQIDRVFAVMALAPQHTYQVLTKRPERMRLYMTALANGQRPLCVTATEIRGSMVGGLMVQMAHGSDRTDGPPYRPWPFLHLGVSVENQATADERIQLLLQTPASVRWISAEPLLGPIDLTGYDDGSWWTEDGQETEQCLDWVVVGGESGPDHRPMNLDWLRSIVEQCRAAHVPVWVKQDSGPKPGRQGRIPDALWIQEPAR